MRHPLQRVCNVGWQTYGLHYVTRSLSQRNPVSIATQTGLYHAKNWYPHIVFLFMIHKYFLSWLFVWTAYKYPNCYDGETSRTIMPKFIQTNKLFGCSAKMYCYHIFWDNFHLCYASMVSSYVQIWVVVSIVCDIQITRKTVVSTSL